VVSEKGYAAGSGRWGRGEEDDSSKWCLRRVMQRV